MANFETKTQEQFENFKKEVQSNKVMTFPITLSDFEFISENYVKVMGKAYKLRPKALKNFLRLLNINEQAMNSFSKNLGQEGRDKIVLELKKAISNSGNAEFNVSIDFVEKEVKNVSNKSTPILPADKYFDMVEQIVNERGLEISDMGWTPNGGYYISTLGEDKELNIEGMKNNEAHNFGLSMKNDPESGTSFLPYSYRQVCANGMMMVDETEEIGAKLKGFDQDSIDKFLETIEQISINGFAKNYYAEKVRLLNNLPASYYEVVDAKNKVNQHILNEKDELSKEERKNAMEAYFPLDHINKRFMQKGVDISQYKKKALQNIKTDTAVWDLINNVTEIASNNINGFEKDNGARSELQSYAGEVFTKKEFDAQNIFDQVV